MKSATRVALVLAFLGILLTVSALPAQAATIPVNSAADTAADDGACTLREAIIAANTDAASGVMTNECPAGSGADTITFDITPDTISPTLALPTITTAMTVDGTSDPNSDRVTIDGTSAPAGANGLTVSTPESTVGTIKGLVIQEFSADSLSGTGGNGIRGALGSLGMLTIGGTAANEGNVLGNNEGFGADGVGSTGTFVFLGNVVGLVADGTTPAPNQAGGVSVAGNNSVVGGTTGVTPGGSCTGACNLLSSNSGAGLTLHGFGAQAKGNFIGTDRTGLTDKGNSQYGIDVPASTGSTIGGTAVAERNVISGNDFGGIVGTDQNSNNIQIKGNYIGVGTDGTTSVPNARGIYVSGDNNSIGGILPSPPTCSGPCNVIANNTFAGVIVDTGATGASILGNSIHTTTGGLGIELLPFGVTANDAGDPDSGANNRQNFPVLTSATSDVTSTTVQGTLNSTADTMFTLEFFSNTSCDTSGYGEGALFLGTSSEMTDGSGDAVIDETFSTSVPGGQFITATATDPSTNTSEFSACRQVSGSGATTISISDTTVNEGNGGTTVATFTVALSSSSTTIVTVNYATADDSATAPTDYQSTSGTVTFAPMDTSETVSVLVNGDMDDEPTESFFVNLSDSSGPMIADAQGVGTITNDDDVPTLSIGDASVTEGDSGTTPATFTVTRSGPDDGTSTVDYFTDDDTATAPSDYQQATGTLTFMPMDNTETITVLVNGDTAPEPTESFFVSLNDATAATIADGQGDGMINDDGDQTPPPPTPTVFCLGKPATVTGTSGSDTLPGTAGADVIAGLGGNDVVTSSGGKDLVCGGDGNDRVNAGGGKDRVAGEAGNDKLNGAGGNDRVLGGPGEDRCNGGSGHDKGPGCEVKKKIP